MSRADVEEHSVCSIFIGGLIRKNNRDDILGFILIVNLFRLLTLSIFFTYGRSHKARPSIAQCNNINKILVSKYVEGRRIDLIFCNDYICWPGSSVGIVTGYGLDGPGIESRWGRDFPHLSRRALGPT